MNSASLVFTDTPQVALQDFLSKRDYSKIVCITDKNCERFCLPHVHNVFTPENILAVEAGESYKNLETCTVIWQFLTAKQLDRHSLVVVLGGGVLGDMAGFCAATYKRGIDFVLIPTTLLSQVDASIGGKLGIDFQHFKNHIGVFQQPVVTIISDVFLETLPELELKSGFAEVVKHSLIGDYESWQEIRKHDLANQDWKKLIRASAEFKVKVITEDPREKGLRKILNAGHTIGHAIESTLLEKQTPVTHGEAVAAGLVMEAFLANRKGLISVDYLKEIKGYILSVFGKIETETLRDDLLIEKAFQDKKNRGNEILCVLLKENGDAVWDVSITAEEIKMALAYYRSA
jgi:3-dehydroquinate synthase